jgi:DNA-binding Lrp family transcriptional regulator
VAAGARAAKAVAANPRKSDRAIAAELGVSHTTIQNARKATGNNLPVEGRSTVTNVTVGRLGLDGKVRKLPKLKTKVVAPEAANEKIKAFVREIVNLMFRMSQFKNSGQMPSDEMRKGLVSNLYQCAEEIMRLAQAIDGRDPEAAWSEEHD